MTTPFSTTSSGSGSFGPFAATSPSSGRGVTSSSRRSSLAARDAKRADPRLRRVSHARALAPRTPPPPPGRRRPSRGASQLVEARAHSSSSAGVERPRSERRVDREQLVVGHAGELGRPVEVVRELAPSGRPRDLGLAPQRRRGGANVGCDERARARGLERDVVEREPGGRLDEVRAPRAERVVDGRVEGHAPKLYRVARDKR